MIITCMVYLIAPPRLERENALSNLIYADDYSSTLLKQLMEPAPPLSSRLRASQNV